MTRRSMTANEAKTRFGEILLMCQREPVHISKHGKPVAVLMAAEDFVSNEELKQELLRLRAELAMEQIAASATQDGGELFEQLLRDGE